MASNTFHLKGLTNEQVLEARKKYGQNKLDFKKESTFFEAIKSLTKEPMVLLLLVASLIYFISGKTGDGIFLASAIVLVATISLYQDSRSRNALQKLKNFTQPQCKVIRDSKVVVINTEEIVVGDYLIVEEGDSIAADGTIIQSNDFSINESILTGESLSVYKDKTKDDNQIYLGTNVVSGLAVACITAIGTNSNLGKIGKSLESIVEEKTPLEIQINNFVKKMVLVGAIVFLIVWLINYFNTKNVLDSLLKALTLAMSILPEEIPVAFTTFMALGAWRLMKMGIVVKQMKTVETLGSANVICVDKTGTITENKMKLAKLYLLKSNTITNTDNTYSDDEKELIRLAMWASEPFPFDPMEVELHNEYKQSSLKDERPYFRITQEYPLEGTPPMMTHVFSNKNGERIIAAKGAPETIMRVSDLSAMEKSEIEVALKTMAKEGFRVLGVANSDFSTDDFPKNQEDIKFVFKGLVAFYDPPKHNISSVLKDFYQAGIKVKIITGDNAETTASIAKQVDFVGYEKQVTGNELMQLTDADLKKCVMDTNIFVRMFPEAKLKIINVLKANGQIVAMTGDGVNDGPALKAAHIGIAMGKKGTEIAKQAASLILLEDDLSKMVDAVAMGRKIYSNLKKAIQYIISIHIPIILTVFIPLVLGWIYPNIFSPLHVIFLELIMGPTCSIIYENEPMEKNTMKHKPKPMSVTFFNWEELSISILQGLAITCGTLFIYQYSVKLGNNEALTRTLVFTVLIIANIFLTLINRSFYYSILTTLKYKNNLILTIILITLSILGLLLYVKPLATFFEFTALTVNQLVICFGVGFASVIWFEIVKFFKRRKGIA
jgi:P-type Ca2+ transporter type 2C